jgi:hypothetical protein
MRKRIINQSSKESSSPDQDWLDLGRLARVEITSEDAGHPVESALTADGGPGWLAGEPGEQTIRLLFDEPQALRKIQLVFEDESRSVPMSLCCAGRGTAAGRTGRFCASSTRSARPVRLWRSRTSSSTFRG